MTREKKSEIIYIIKFILGLAFGVTLIVFPEKSIDAICYIMGIAAIALGIIGIVVYITKNEIKFNSLTLILSVICIICGILLCIHPEFVKRIIPTIVGLFIIIDSAIKIVSTLNIKGKSPYWTLTFTLSLIGLVLGILVIAFGDKVADIIAILSGVALLVESIESFIIFLAFKKHIKSNTGNVTFESTEYSVKSSESHDDSDSQN